MGRGFILFALFAFIIIDASSTSISVGIKSRESSSFESYFGNGCFWDLQHLLVTKAETSELKRNASEITSVCGYAGGKGKSDRLCYHNENNTDDYGELGHAEVVGIRVNDEEALFHVASVFFRESFVRLPGSSNYTRKDMYDLGPEYRALVGIPGGLKGEYGDTLRRANVHGMALKEGRGSDPVRATFERSAAIPVR